MKLIIETPPSHTIEREYIHAIIFTEILGISWKHKISNRNNIKITLDGYQGQIILPDVFFSITDDKWLTLDSLPVLPLSLLDAEELKIPITLANKYIPVIYGEAGSNVSIKSNQIYLPLDIIGSSFFMLSRYEELVNQERDEHDRFPAKASIAYKEGFLERPIVDEYIEIIWNYITHIWPSLNRKKFTSQINISCDVDQPFDCTVESATKLIKAVAGDLLKRRSISLALKRINRYLFNSIGIYKYDYNYTFNWYMDICDNAGLHAVFYFIPTTEEPGNGCYTLKDKKIIELLKLIYRRGHTIGVHSTYQTYMNCEKLSKQKHEIENAISRAGITQHIYDNRQHYLRWNSSITPDCLDKAGIKYDSTGGYADYVGFRYGTAKTFSMWSWGRKRKLTLKQRPLIVMDTTLLSEEYMGILEEQVIYKKIES